MTWNYWNTCHILTVSHSETRLGANGTYISLVSGSSQGRALPSKFYWDKDIHATAKIWQTYSKAIEQGQPGAVQAFEAWKEERKMLVESMQKVRPSLQRVIETSVTVYLEMVPTFERWVHEKFNPIKEEECRSNRRKRLEVYAMPFR